MMSCSFDPSSLPQLTSSSYFLTNIQAINHLTRLQEMIKSEVGDEDGRMKLLAMQKYLMLGF